MHMKSILIPVNKLEKIKMNLSKINYDIKVIKPCKKDLFPTFTEVQLSIKHSSLKLNPRKSHLILEAVMQN